MEKSPFRGHPLRMRSDSNQLQVVNTKPSHSTTSHAICIYKFITNPYYLTVKYNKKHPKIPSLSLKFTKQREFYSVLWRFHSTSRVNVIATKR